MFSGRDYLQTGYVVNASNMSVDDYIHECFLLGTVSVMYENGTVQKDVRVTEEVLQNIVFPDPNNNETLGSALILLNVPRHNLSVGIGILPKPNERIILSPFQKMLFSALKGSAAYLSVDGKGNIVISAYSDNPEKKGIF